MGAKAPSNQEIQMKNTLIGAGIGFGFGCATGLGKAAVTVLCPVLWIPGTAASCALAGGMVAQANEAEPGVTAACAVAGGLVGGVLGTAELVAYPITAPLSLMEAAAMPVIGAVVGGVVGHNVD